jgi:hypothetical protein
VPSNKRKGIFPTAPSIELSIIAAGIDVEEVPKRFSFS